MLPAVPTFSMALSMYARGVETPFSEFLDIAQAAEDLGYEGAYTNDHFYLPADYTAATSDAGDPDRPYYVESWTALAAIAARTSRIRLGHQVTPLPVRHPGFVAKMGATIDLISAGRFVLGLGTGWNGQEYEDYGVPFDRDFKTRYEKTIESIEIIQRLWTSPGPVTYRGDHYRLTDALFWPKPVGRPPMWMGGAGPKVRRLIGERLDGWVPAASQHEGLTPELYRSHLDDIRAAARGAGRDPDAVLPAINFFVVVDGDRERARERARRLTGRVAWRGLTPDDLAERGLILLGTPDDCVAQLRRYVDAGVRHVTFAVAPITDAAGTIDSLSLLAREVVPQFADSLTVY